MLILSFLDRYFSINHKTMFEYLFWNYRNLRHHVLSHFLICTQVICWKIIARIIRFFVRTLFLSAVFAVIVKAKYIQTFQKRNGSFS